MTATGSAASSSKPLESDSCVPGVLPINSSASSSVDDSTDDDALDKESASPSSSDNNNMIIHIAKEGVVKEIHKRVIRQKLNKLRHLVVEQGIRAEYLDTLFPKMLPHYDPQHVTYNGGVAQIKDWKISCYLEVMEGGVPCTNPNLTLLALYRPLLDTCNDLFLEWYRQQHACNHKMFAGKTVTRTCKRIMTFITRYTPAPGEQALLKVSYFVIRIVIITTLHMLPMGSSPLDFASDNKGASPTHTTFSTLSFILGTKRNETKRNKTITIARGWSWKGRWECGCSIAD